MHSQPDWPPVPGALRPSPFPHPVLHALHGLARALLFPAYWALDQLLGCWAPRVRPTCLDGLRLAVWAGAAVLLLVVLGLPLALPGLLLWLPLQAWRRPFCYQPPPPGWAPPAPWRPPAEPARCFGFLSANLCLLPDGLARFSNLQHTQRRADVAGALLLAGLRSSPSRYGATGCSPPEPGAPCGVLTAALPEGLDFVCLQEVFDLRAARPLVSRLAPNLGPVLHDVGDGHLRCQQLTQLLNWAEQFEAESRPSDETVAFSVLLGDLNFDNCCRSDAREQEHPLFSRFRDPCRLDTRREQPWALGTMLRTSRLRHSVACSPEMLRRALEQEEGRHRYLAGPPHGGPRAKPWRGRRLDYITYRGVPSGPLSPEAEQVTFSTALAGLTDHLAVGLRLRVSMHVGTGNSREARGKMGAEAKREPGGPQRREQDD
ncbi:sphingomyelin phosphodiesterase 5-like isoform X2 [Myotis myotis]|uniref:sphingomyelin phosphodiesterase 5-like isoform X2 n=1 Tax=Myotis myotis TaxID=51298 RepID=UPI00174A9FB9|nr:sphingomyelin phosphodiesterase 5-like isoform X2 [Myotis myotis]